MPNQIGSFLNGCKITKHYQKIQSFLKIQWREFKLQNDQISIGIEASTLHEAKYIFKDFTEIDTHS
jgi:hypothetical protein